MKRLIPLLILFLFSAVTAAAATYYIDYAAGSNDADGLTPQSAWKQSPGDKKATGIPAKLELQPGDVLKFKGGVQYYGEIQLKVAGAEGNPIVLDGNTDGKFGEGRAILDGAQMITGWKSVESAEMALGNPLWKEIMYKDLDVDLTTNFDHGEFVPHRDAGEAKQAPWQRVFLIDGEKSVLPIAQRPKPSDSFYPDLPSDYYLTPHRLTNNYPHKIYYEEGTIGNGSLPLIAITYGGNAPVIQPFNGGAVSVEMDKAAPIAEIGFTLYRPATTMAPEFIVFLADGKEVYKATVDPKETEMQRFKLPETVEAKKLTFQLLNSSPDAPTWNKFQQIAAFTPDGENVIQHEISSVIEDEERLTQTDPHWYDGMFVGAHGGNNHVYFSRVKGYEPDTHRLQTAYFSSSTYDTTRYALYNSPKFIDLPGEWCLVPLEGGRTRVFLLPNRLENGQPVNIGYPVLKTAITLASTVSHVDVRGFLIQRYSGGLGGVAISGRGDAKTSYIRIADCEIRFMSGQSGISLNFGDQIQVDNCYIHHCPGWTVGIYVNRTSNYRISGNRLDNNSGSGIRHYEAKHGVLNNNVVINHYGMHSSALNFYEGCDDILFENNYIQNVIAINRNAENLTFRNNVVDSQKRNAVSLAMWTSGRTGGTAIRNIVFENNTFLNVDWDANWSSAIFVQSGRGASPPEGLVIRNNILDRLRPPVPGTIENNIYLRETDPSVAGTGSLVVTDPAELFMDPDKGDFRRKPGGPMMDAGANVAPPPNLN